MGLHEDAHEARARKLFDPHVAERLAEAARTTRDPRTLWEIALYLRDAQEHGVAVEPLALIAVLEDCVRTLGATPVENLSRVEAARWLASICSKYGAFKILQNQLSVIGDDVVNSDAMLLRMDARAWYRLNPALCATKKPTLVVDKLERAWSLAEPADSEELARIEYAIHEYASLLVEHISQHPKDAEDVLKPLADLEGAAASTLKLALHEALSQRLSAATTETQAADNDTKVTHLVAEEGIPSAHINGVEEEVDLLAHAEATDEAYALLAETESLRLQISELNEALRTAEHERDKARQVSDQLLDEISDLRQRAMPLPDNTLPNESSIDADTHALDAPIASETSSARRPESDREKGVQATEAYSILVIGSIGVKQDVLRAIMKDFGLDKDCLDFWDYDDAKRRGIDQLRWSGHYDGIIVGPVAHKLAGLSDSTSLLTELTREGYPLHSVARSKSGKLQISKTSFREAARNLIIALEASR